MKLYEFEGKRLLERAGINIPRGKVVASVEEASGLLKKFGALMVKAQVLWGRRAKAHGVVACENEEQAAAAIKSLIGREMFGETVEKVLVEEKLDVAQEAYVSVTYKGASPVLIISTRGGIDVEEACHESLGDVCIEPVDIHLAFGEEKAKELVRKAGFDGADGVADILLKLYRIFVDCDATLAEINPLIRTSRGEWIAADAKVEIDDDALYRQKNLNLPERLSSGRMPTRLEWLALENDRRDRRGSAGRMFYELDGNIIVLASGGGTSVEALDDLCLLGGKPAVFTEYSGNPTPEKVKGLTKITMMYPRKIDAIWVIGGRANFTDIYDTLISGIMGGIRETKNFDKSIPIIIRRAGPRDEEAFETLHKVRDQEGYNIFLRGMATSVADSARMVIHQANKHRNRK
jgi:succinyl-CoA synthetase beta subunit